MKSRIRLTLNEQGEPTIRIECCNSEDVRDQLIKRYVDGLGYNSNWARVSFKDYATNTQGDTYISLEIEPINENDLEHTIKVMQGRIEKLKEKNVVSSSLPTNVLESNDTDLV